ncbi:hypothetical protein MSAN_01384400 [Mycena sanguinolenta]|uniref:DUF5648 domain-containing protein n=1 Tax=Mycena sanguinolenta TaxID=230812 RepID=A0A8H6Y8S3_9AGAR|nr:hypothetical protein MSAN_01384400 [Mycena sanguinolenta]
MRAGILSLIAATATLVASVVAQTCSSGSICGSTSSPWYRLNTLPPVSDHFYTMSSAEYVATLIRTDISTVAEGVAAGIFATQEGASVPLFRLYNNQPFNDHIYTIDANEAIALEAEGYNLEDITGYVYSEQHLGTISLVTNAFLSQGYVDQGISCYVPLAGATLNQDIC